MPLFHQYVFIVMLNSMKNSILYLVHVDALMVLQVLTEFVLHAQCPYALSAHRLVNAIYV